MATATTRSKSSRKPTARVARFHAALIGGTTVFAQTGRTAPVAVHFRQSELDGACGLCCVSMVLAVFGLVKASALEAMARRRFGIAAQVWNALKHTFFTGVHAPELCNAVRSIGLPLRLTMRHVEDSDDIVGHRAVANFALASLRRGALVIVAYQSLRDRTRHFVLAVGVGAAEYGRPAMGLDHDTIYVLDPSSDTVSLAVYNSVLTRVQRKGTAHPAWNMECGAGYQVPVTLISAIRFDLA